MTMRTEDRIQESGGSPRKLSGQGSQEASNRFWILDSAFGILHPRRKTAFSLVEVTLALAVAAIGLVAILGLIPHGVQASRDAADNTLAATIVLDTFNLLRTNAFEHATICDACQPSPPSWVALENIDLSKYNQSASNVYDQAGFATDFFNVTNIYFKVILDFQPQTPLTNLTRVTATVVWPAQSSTPAHTNVFVTQIARFDK